MLEGIPLEYEPLSCLLGIGKKGGSNFFENHLSTVRVRYGVNFFFSKIVYQGLLRVMGLEG